MLTLTYIANYERFDPPFKATVFFLTELIATSDITDFPPLIMGVTSTSSHWIGTWRKGYEMGVIITVRYGICLGCSVDIPDRLGDFGANTWRETERVSFGWTLLE